MEQTKVRKEEIYFNEVGYNIEVKNYDNKRHLEDMIQQEFSKYKVDFDKDIMEQFYNMICEKYKEKNTLDLSGKKLCDLLEIDCDNIIALASRHKPYVGMARPRKDVFKLYAQSDKELYKLDYAKKLIKVIKELQEHKHLHKMEVIRFFHPIIKLNAVSEFVVNPAFIKN